MNAESGLKAFELIREEYARSCFKNNVEVQATCIASENKKKISCFSSMLGARYNYREFCALKRRIVKDGFYPIVRWNNGSRTIIVCRSINLMFSCFLIYKFSSILFTIIITPYILPAYRRKVWADN